jgi:hypothetical protein
VQFHKQRKEKIMSISKTFETYLSPLAQAKKIKDFLASEAAKKRAIQVASEYRNYKWFSFHTFHLGGQNLIMGENPFCLAVRRGMDPASTISEVISFFESASEPELMQFPTGVLRTASEFFPEGMVGEQVLKNVPVKVLAELRAAHANYVALFQSLPDAPRSYGHRLDKEVTNAAAENRPIRPVPSHEMATEACKAVHHATLKSMFSIVFEQKSNLAIVWEVVRKAAFQTIVDREKMLEKEAKLLRMELQDTEDGVLTRLCTGYRRIVEDAARAAALRDSDQNSLMGILSNFADTILGPKA